MAKLIGAVSVGGEPPRLPAEIAMHKARKALKQLGPDGPGETLTATTLAESWWPMIIGAIDALESDIQRGCIYDELNNAPNLVLAGNSTMLVRWAIGMSDDQLIAVAELALTLP